MENTLSWASTISIMTGKLQDYLQREMPTVLIIDKEGILNARAPGVDAEQLIPYLKKML